MDKNILTLALCLIVNLSFSQITINVPDLAQADDTVLITKSTQFADVEFNSTGVDHNWDFSHLFLSEQRTDTFYNVSNASFTYQLVFNNALTQPNHVSDYYNNFSGALPEIPGGIVEINNPVFFTKNSSNASVLTGLGLEVNGFQVPAQADTVDTLYHFPLTYNDQWMSRSYLLVDMNPIFDAQFKRHQQREVVVDGWGQITTHFGTFDAVRVKSTITYQDSILFDLTGQGNPSWFPLPTPQDVEYTWWTNNNKVPVLKINTQNNQATLIEYRDHIIGTGVKENDFEFQMYPNPVNDVLNLNDVPNNSKVEIIDYSGKTILVKENINGNLSINTSNLPKGIYIMMITAEKGQSIQKFIKQ